MNAPDDLQAVILKIQLAGHISTEDTTSGAFTTMQLLHQTTQSLGIVMLRKSSSSDADIGTDLKRARASAHVKQDEIAAYLGISPQQYSKYERGEDRIAASRFREAMEFFRTKAGSNGFTDNQFHYLAGPGRVDRPSSLDNIKQDWERLKRLVDSFIGALRDQTK